MSTEGAVLRVESVAKQFVGVRAVDELSFDVRPGEIFALLGPNGAGKTTVVRMLVGILKPDSGRFTLTALEQGGRIGYLPEERGLHRDTPVLRTLEYFGVLQGMPRAEARQAALDGLAHFDLAGRERERVDALSKGNQQKVQFLAAVLHRPRFAVLDEPFSGLDPVNQQRFVDEIRKLRDAGCTILLSAHQMDLVETLADRILLMDQGRSVLHGTLPEIRSQADSGLRLQVEVAAGTQPPDLSDIAGVREVLTAETRLEILLDPEAAVGDILHAVTGRVPVTSVHTGAETLREIFVRTVGRQPETDSMAGERS